MTEQEKQGVLESFQALYEQVEARDDSAQFQSNADQLIAAAGNHPLPFINAAMGELDEANRLRETKANVLKKLSAGIEFIKFSKAEDLTHDRIKSHMDNA